MRFRKIAPFYWTFFTGLGIMFCMKKRDNSRKKTAQTLTLITQIGLIMISAVGMTTALGIWLDGVLHTSFLTVLLFFVGAIAGVQGAYRTVEQIFGNDGKKKDEDSEKGR